MFRSREATTDTRVQIQVLLHCDVLDAGVLLAPGISFHSIEHVQLDDMDFAAEYDTGHSHGLQSGSRSLVSSL